MKKVLYGLLGAILLASPLKGLSQESEEKTYEYNIYLGEKRRNIGTAMCTSEKVDFTLKKIHNLTFYKNDTIYEETSKFFLSGEEKYIYAEKKDFLKLENYIYSVKGKEQKNGGRKDKREKEGNIYSKDILLGTEIFEIFEGNSIPSEFELMVFGDKYSCKKILEKRINDSLIEVHYNLPLNPKGEGDRVRIKEPFKIYLEREKDGTYSPVGAKTMLEYKLLWWFDIDLEILKKGYHLN